MKIRKLEINLITVSRMIASLLLLRLTPLSGMFLFVYFYCGIADFFDGFLARKTKNLSTFGAKLDSVADIIFVTCIVKIFLPYFAFKSWMLIWILSIIIIRFVIFIISIIKFKEFAIINLYSNKITNFLLFCFPISFFIMGFVISVILIATFASIACIEEFIIVVKDKTLNANAKSVFKSK